MIMCSTSFIVSSSASSGRFYCEPHSEELELGNGAETSYEVGHRTEQVQTGVDVPLPVMSAAVVLD